MRRVPDTKCTHANCHMTQPQLMELVTHHAQETCDGPCSRQAGSHVARRRADALHCFLGQILDDGDRNFDFDRGEGRATVKLRHGLLEHHFCLFLFVCAKGSRWIWVCGHGFMTMRVWFHVTYLPWAQCFASQPDARALTAARATSPPRSCSVERASRTVWFTTSSKGSAASRTVLTDSADNTFRVAPRDPNIPSDSWVQHQAMQTISF